MSEETKAVRVAPDSFWGGFLIGAIIVAGIWASDICKELRGIREAVERATQQGRP